jgi:signal transduction histidine kinase
MNRSSHLIEVLLPEFERRHAFVTKLRLVLYGVFWGVFLFFQRDVLPQVVVPGAVMVGALFAACLSYVGIARRRLILPAFAAELLSDLVALTVIVYLTDGPHSSYFTVYLLYVLVAGVLYNHYLAVLLAAASAACYGLFLLLCDRGVIRPLILEYGDRFPVPGYTPPAHFLLLLLLLATVVYTVKIASTFSQRRERILERRNRELTALTRMGTTIRSVIEPRAVIEQLLAGLLEGLNLETVVLVRFDRSEGHARLYLPERHPHLSEIEAAIGRALGGLEFPMAAIEHSVMRDLMRHRIVFRREISELVIPDNGIVTREQGRRIQDVLRVHRIVIVPVVAEHEVLAALIGFAREPFVEEELVATLEAFANQSALSLEAALLIERLKKVNVELEEASRVKSEFLAAMSHELRTPLTAIIGFTELLTEGVMGELTEEQHESLQEVLHNAADLLEMINSLLDLTKIESGRMKLELRPFDLREVLRRVSGTLAPLVHKKRQSFAVDLPEKLSIMTGDERKVQQVLLNLLANANKFTPDGGHISVSLREVVAVDAMGRTGWAERFEGRLASLASDCVEVTVADDGIGIPREQLTRIFDMFHQADSGSTRSFGGTGLGLALARRFIEMHGGCIWAESELGKGARFTAIIPLVPPSENG